MNESTSPDAQSQALKARLAILSSSAVVGIDIAKRKHFACGLDPEGQTIQAPFSFTNDEAGFQQLLDRVTDLGTQCPRESDPVARSLSLGLGSPA